jgi:predicted transcriptional regulator
MPDGTQAPLLGPEQMLGDLEAAVMQVLWERGESTVRAVQAALQPTRPLAYTTVMTVMSRLAQKQILSVRRAGKTYYYRALAATPADFMAQQAQRAVQELIATFGDVAIAHFLHTVDDIAPERLAALRALTTKGAEEDVDAS